MYIPKDYKVDDIDEILAFMREYNFATIVTSENQTPTATHLPFVIERRGEKTVLISHFAKANNQLIGIENKYALVIFIEPHAYISPMFYEKQLNVPTWNYVSVHAYGNVKLIHGEAETFESLEKMIMSFEPAYRKQWDGLPQEYKVNMAKGIVPFEIEVDDMQGKKKLSQNKTDREKENIINAFKVSSNTNEQTIAHMMEELKEKQ